MDEAQYYEAIGQIRRHGYEIASFSEASRKLAVTNASDEEYKESRNVVRTSYRKASGILREIARSDDSGDNTEHALGVLIESILANTRKVV